MFTADQLPRLAPEQYVDIDVARIALGGISRIRVYQLARSEHWRHDHGRPRGYLLADIRTTAQKRRKDTP
jgi:hypothetical protein